MNPGLLLEAFVLIALASAGVNYLLRTSDYMEHARDWWWKRAPRAEWALPKDEKPGRVWPLKASRSWQHVYADEHGFPRFFDDHRKQPALAELGVEQRTCWYSKDGIMLGRVLACRTCFGSWCTAVCSVPILWPSPGGWGWRSVGVRVLVVFGAWPVAVLVNRLFEAEGGKE